MDSHRKTMQHLTDYSSIENILANRRVVLEQAGSFTFNIAIFCIGIFAFIMFLKGQYKATQEAPEKIDIPFTPMLWHSATKNVRMNDYGAQLQPFEIEAGHSFS
jgi:hypothetical protein